MRLPLLLGLALALAGCSLSLDTDAVKLAPCVPTGCSGKACGYDDCGTVCVQGSGCQFTASVGRASIGAAGRASAAAGHAVEGGLSAGAATVAAPAGHSVVSGTVSQ